MNWTHFRIILEAIAQGLVEAGEVNGKKRDPTVLG